MVGPAVTRTGFWGANKRHAERTSLPDFPVESVLRRDLCDSVDGPVPPNSRTSILMGSDQPTTRPSGRVWVQVLLIGLLIWLAGIAVTEFTRDPILIPGVFLTGSFLVPFSLMLWVFGQTDWGGTAPPVGRSALGPSRLLLAFALGGAVGVWCSALLENLLMRIAAFSYYLDVAVVEESVKLTLVWLIAHRLGWYSRRDGMLLGATVGLGFAAFESAGYAFHSAALGHSDKVLAVFLTQVSRGLLMPVGHGLWTAMVAGALFAAARNGRLRLTWNVLGWLLIAIGLHMFWDMASGFSAMFAAWASGAPVIKEQFLSGRLTDPTFREGVYYALSLTLLLLLNAGIAVSLWVREWRKANREQDVDSDVVTPRTSGPVQ